MTRILLADDHAVVRSGLKVLLQQRGLQVVAEGVETLEEWCWLQSVGIRLFQGFLFSRPCLNGIGEICWPVARQAMDL